jgi:choline dehydrogenase-like flavoprotein
LLARTLTTLSVNRDLTGLTVASKLTEDLNVTVHVIKTRYNAHKDSFTFMWHPIATLDMMKKELEGVLDSRLQVYGNDNVRLVDVSVPPVQLSAYLSSSLYGIAEKVSENTKEDWAGK